MRSKPFVFLNSNSKFFKLRYYDNGVPKTISTGIECIKRKEKECKDKAEAWADEFLRDPKQEEKLKSPILFSTFIKEKFLPGNALSNGSVRNYLSVEKIFTAIVPDKFIHQYTTIDFNRFIDARQEVSAHTLKNNVTHLTAIFNYAVSENYIKSNPVHKAKPVKTKKVKIVYFKNDDFNKLVNAVDEEIVSDIIYFAVYTGMRASEIFSLELSNVELKSRVIRNYQNKVDDYNVISIANDIYEIVQKNYELNHSLGHNYLFTYVNKKTKERKQVTVNWASDMVKKAIRKAGLPEHYCFKSLRKTFGSKLLQSGVPLDRVSHLLGHADMRITKQHYAQLSKEYDATVDLVKMK